MSARIVLVLLLALGCTACGGSEDGVGNIAGTYVLDREALTQDFLADELRHMDATEREQLTAGDKRAILTELRASVAERDMRLDLLADGTFVVRYRYESEEGRRRGTWRLGGRDLLLRTTHGTSGELAQPSEVRGVVLDGALRFEAGDTLPHPFTLRRR